MSNETFFILQRIEIVATYLQKIKFKNWAYFEKCIEYY